MAALTKERDTPEISNGGRRISLPVKGGATIYQGALVAGVKNKLCKWKYRIRLAV